MACCSAALAVTNHLVANLVRTRGSRKREEQGGKLRLTWKWIGSRCIAKC